MFCRTKLKLKSGVKIKLDLTKFLLYFLLPGMWHNSFKEGIKVKLPKFMTHIWLSYHNSLGTEALVLQSCANRISSFTRPFRDYRGFLRKSSKPIKDVSYMKNCWKRTRLQKYFRCLINVSKVLLLLLVLSLKVKKGIKYFFTKVCNFYTSK